MSPTTGLKLLSRCNNNPLTMPHSGKSLSYAFHSPVFNTIWTIMKIFFKSSIFKLFRTVHCFCSSSSKNIHWVLRISMKFCTSVSVLFHRTLKKFKSRRKWAFLLYWRCLVSEIKEATAALFVWYPGASCIESTEKKKDLYLHFCKLYYGSTY